MRQTELPEYQCHKRVRACRIKAIVQDADGRYMVHPAEEGLDPVEVPAQYVARHKPAPGGYLVQYRDGYLSFSPAQEFEDGYLPINELAGRRERLINQLIDVEAAIAAKGASE